MALSQGASLQSCSNWELGWEAHVLPPNMSIIFRLSSVVSQVLLRSLRPGAPDSSSLRSQFFRSGCGFGCGFDLYVRAPFKIVSHCLLFFFHLFFLGSGCLLLGCQPLDLFDGHLLLQGHISLYRFAKPPLNNRLTLYLEFFKQY